MWESMTQTKKRGKNKRNRKQSESVVGVNVKIKEPQNYQPKCSTKQNYKIQEVIKNLLAVLKKNWLRLTDKITRETTKLNN